MVNRNALSTAASTSCGRSRSSVSIWPADRSTDCSAVLKLMRPLRAWTEMRPSVRWLTSRPPDVMTISTTRKSAYFANVFAVCPDCQRPSDRNCWISRWRSKVNSGPPEHQLHVLAPLACFPCLSCLRSLYPAQAAFSSIAASPVEYPFAFLTSICPLWIRVSKQG